MTTMKTPTTQFTFSFLFYFLCWDTAFSSMAAINTFKCFDQFDNYTSNSTFTHNLNSLLLALNFSSSSNIASADPAPRFYRTSAGSLQNPNDTVYGLVQCRGDTTPKECLNCTSYAAFQIIHTCPNFKSAVLWSDQCLLHYAPVNFFGKIDTLNRLMVSANNSTISSSSSDSSNNGNGLFWQPGYLLNDLISNLTRDGEKRLFETGSVGLNDGTTHLYGLVQCTNDLSVEDCASCLKNLTSDLTQQYGFFIMTTTCFASIQNYQFFKFVATSPPPLPSSPFSNDNRGSSTQNTKMKIIAVVATIVSAAFLLSLLSFCLLRRKRRRLERARQKSLSVRRPKEGMEALMLELSIIKAATNNFSEDNKVGAGGYGPVYKGRLSDGQEIAVKRLAKNSGQGEAEFKNEVKLVAMLQHKNLVRLLGCCLEEDEKILVYEYVPNHSLNYFLFDKKKSVHLDWKVRTKIIVGIARGLVYLHEDSRLRIIHRDLKAGNILLDMNMNPKIADFGMAKLFDMHQTEGNTNRIAGTFGYMAPEYAMHGLFSVKSDVYSFGVLTLEIVSGLKNSSTSRVSPYARDLTSYAYQLWKENRILELLDLNPCDSSHLGEELRFVHIGLLCIQENAEDRPTMSAIVNMFNNESLALPSPLPPAFYMEQGKGKKHGSSSGSTYFKYSSGGLGVSSSESGSRSTNRMTITDLHPR